MTAPSPVQQAHEAIDVEQLPYKNLVVSRLLNGSTHQPSKASTVCLDNPRKGPKVPTLTQNEGSYPSEHVEVDFTDTQPSRGHQYLLVTVRTVQ